MILGTAVRLLGSRVAVADYLGVDREAVDRWTHGGEQLPSNLARQLRDLVEVLEAIARLPRNTVAPGWLRTPCAALDGATPEDVLVVDGAARVLAVLPTRV